MGIGRQTAPLSAEEVEARRRIAHESKVLELPFNTPKDYGGEPSADGVDTVKGPIKILFALDFSKYLRAVSDFGPAGDAWANYNAGRSSSVRVALGRIRPELACSKGVRN